MGLVYVYLVAWVAGGVVLGANMLLSQHPELPERETPAPHRPRAGKLAAQVAALGLIGFGLGGLVSEGLGLWRSPWTETCAVVSALLLGAVGYLSVHLERG
jgi:hypothetical protein